MHSDFVFQACADALSEKLPNAKVIRTDKTQTYGQVAKMLEIIHGPEKAPALIENFRKSLMGK